MESLCSSLSWNTKHSRLILYTFFQIIVTNQYFPKSLLQISTFPKSLLQISIFKSLLLQISGFRLYEPPPSDPKRGLGVCWSEIVLTHQRHDCIIHALTSWGADAEADNDAYDQQDSCYGHGPQANWEVPYVLSIRCPCSSCGFQAQSETVQKRL